jgi:predicted ATPase
LTTGTTIRSTRDPLEGTLTRVTLRGFKAFDFQPIQLAPITILVGPNNSGKSSVMGSLKVLQNTLLSPDPQIPIALGEFGTFQDAVHGNDPKSPLGI